MSTTLTVVDADSIAYKAAYSPTIDQMYGLIDSILQDCFEQGACSKMLIFIESLKYLNNFRHHVAYTRPYKGNRSERPETLPLAKKYMAQRWKATVVTGMESEDRMSIAAYRNGLDKTLMCCIDKDCNQIPGRFYNYDKHQRHEVSQAEADLNFYIQVLCGDSTDNIVGIPGVGPFRAMAILTEDKETPFPIKVGMTYRDRGLSYAYMLQMARLVYLLRSDNDIFTFPFSERDYEENNLIIHALQRNDCENGKGNQDVIKPYAEPEHVDINFEATEIDNIAF